MNNLNEIVAVGLMVVSALTFCGLSFWTIYTHRDHPKKHKKA